MDTTTAQRNGYGYIIATINGAETYIPEDEGNAEYAALVAAGVDITDAAVPTIDDTRAGTSIDRAAFCNGLADLSIITDAEAIDAARGIWPASMAGFLTLLDKRQQRDAQIEWASCATVQRMHWVVLSMISVGIVTEAQADALCGITP
jgi:hypothetical protein